MRTWTSPWPAPPPGALPPSPCLRGTSAASLLGRFVFYLCQTVPNCAASVNITQKSVAPLATYGGRHGGSSRTTRRGWVHG